MGAKVEYVKSPPLGEQWAEREFEAVERSIASITPLYLYMGTGSPENAVTAPVGGIYIRTDGGAGTTLYVKESGSGDTGWVGK